MRRTYTSKLTPETAREIRRVYAEGNVSQGRLARRYGVSQSLGANTTVTPKVDKDLIAVGKHHQYKILGQTDLAACTKLGQNFLCEGRSVLRTDIEDSCLGALYLHNLPATSN